MKSVVHKGTGSEGQGMLTVWEAECYRKGRWEHKLNWKKITSVNSRGILGVKAVFHNCYHWLGEHR